jgi:hypothetical protein
LKIDIIKILVTNLYTMTSKEDLDIRAQLTKLSNDMAEVLALVKALTSGDGLKPPSKPRARAKKAKEEDDDDEETKSEKKSGKTKMNVIEFFNLKYNEEGDKFVLKYLDEADVEAALEDEDFKAKYEKEKNKEKKMKAKQTALYKVIRDKDKKSKSGVSPFKQLQTDKEEYIKEIQKKNTVFNENEDENEVSD